MVIGYFELTIILGGILGFIIKNDKLGRVGSCILGIIGSFLLQLVFAFFSMSYAYVSLFTVIIIGILFIITSMQNKRVINLPSNEGHGLDSSKVLASTVSPIKTKTQLQQGRYGEAHIFISYRRQDSADITGRIYDKLSQHYEKKILFRDIDSIPLGVDFREHLEDALRGCKVFIAVIGNKWLSREESSKERRIDNPRDHVRIEIERALSLRIPVIPVLVQGAKIPEESELPSTLQGLSFRNGIIVRPDPDFHKDMDRLIIGLEQYLKS